MTGDHRATREIEVVRTGQLRGAVSITATTAISKVFELTSAGQIAIAYRGKSRELLADVEPWLGEQAWPEK